jgi:hypothetical protein
MMGRGNMGKQIATAPATPRMTGMDRARQVANPNASFMRPAEPVMKMSTGGSVSRADGCCMKGKTKGKKY